MRKEFKRKGFVRKRIGVLLLLCAAMVMSFAGCSSGESIGNVVEGKDDREKEKPSLVDIPEFSSEYLVGVSVGGSSWGEYYECISAGVKVCKNHDIIITMPTKAGPGEETESGEIATLTLTDEQYNNIEKGIDLVELYTLDPDEDREVCDGGSTIITIYDADGNVLKNCGGYMPRYKRLHEMHDLILDNLPLDEIYEIRAKQIELLRESE